MAQSMMFIDLSAHFTFFLGVGANVKKFGAR